MSTPTVPASLTGSYTIDCPSTARTGVSTGTRRSKPAACS